MTTTPTGRADNRSGAARDKAAREARRFETLVRLSRAALFWERLWPALWPLAGVALTFLAVSLAGLWLAAPPAAAAVVRVVFLIAALAALWPLVRLRWPSRAEALARLDRTPGAPPGLASAWEDRLAAGAGDPLAQALWARRREALRRQLAQLRPAPPRVAMADRDRYALRAAPLMAAVAAAFIAGPQWRERLAPAFSFDIAFSGAGDRRLDGWIDPPRYTRRPPLMLDLSGAGGRQAVRAPAGSVLVAQAAGGSALRVDVGGGLTPLRDGEGDGEGQTAGPPPPGLQRARFRIAGDGQARIRAGGRAHDIAISVIPDAPPTVALSGRPQGGPRGTLTIAYVAKDDYGLASGEAEIRLPGAPQGRSLAKPPQIRLNLPSNPAAGAEMKTVAEVASHPWAGAEVDLTLVVRDDAGQEGRSETVRITLPQRVFADPLARALVELRRDLILTPDTRPRVQTALDALLVAPELFTPRAGHYLGLRRVDRLLRDARSDDDLRDVAGQLWELALVVEEGDLSDAERQLRQAQQALRDAIERGAGEEEIRRLSRELRLAMNRYMAEMGRQARARGQQPADPNATPVTRDDLQKLLDRIEELTREGRREEAARLLDRLREIMENLQMAQPSQGGDGQGQNGDDGSQGEQARRLGQALGELDGLMREQQALRDETFRQGQRAGRDPDAGTDDDDAAQDGAPAPGQRPGRQDQGGQGADGRGGPGARPGEAPQRQGGGAQPGENGAGPGQELAQRQQALRQRLEALRQRLKREGADAGKGFGEAGEEMDAAGEALKRGGHGEAVDAQGRALEQLRRSAQDLARQMAEADGARQGAAGRDGEGGEDSGRGAASGDRPQTDPLGRPLRGVDRGLGRMETGETGEAAGERARRILDELRRRLGERQREREELDYLERLLGPR